MGPGSLCSNTSDDEIWEFEFMIVRGGIYSTMEVSGIRKVVLDQSYSCFCCRFRVFLVGCQRYFTTVVILLTSGGG